VHETEDKTYFGWTIFRFLLDSLSGANGGTAPHTLPTETSISLRLSITKLLSNLTHRQHWVTNEDVLIRHSRVLPDTVNGSLDAPPVRDLHHALDSVLVPVQDDVACASLLRDVRLCLGTRCPNDGCPARLRDLRE
jgi:hypothetical protein